MQIDCPKCDGTGWEHLEAMTDHEHPIPIEWPCRARCAASGRRGQRPQVTPEDARNAWMTKTGGRFHLCDELEDIL